MIHLEKHHLTRIDAIAAHTGRDAADVLAEAIETLGPAMTHGALADWLWAECVRVGLELPAVRRKARAEELARWERIEAALEPAAILDADDVRAAVNESPAIRRSIVRLNFGKSLT